MVFVPNKYIFCKYLIDIIQTNNLLKFKGFFSAYFILFVFIRKLLILNERDCLVKICIF